MKKIFYIKDNIENRISYYHLLFFMLSLPFDRFYSTIILVSFLTHTLIFLKRTQLRQIGSRTFILQSVFMVTLISMIHTAFVSRGWETVTRQLAIFLFPALFAVTPLDISKYRPTLLRGLALGCTFTLLYLFMDALRVMRYYDLPLKDLFSPAFVNQNFSLPLNMHATYLSMLLVISLVYFLQQLLFHDAKAIRIYVIVCAAILMAGLIQLGSKSVLFALLLIINIGFPWFLPGRKVRFRFLSISLFATALLLTLISSVAVFRNRYVIQLKEDLYENTAIVANNGRIDRWDAAVDLIKRSPLFGTGSGSEIPLLKELYFERKMYSAYLSSLNAHNQYLSFLINSGVTGLLVYLGTLFWGFRRAIKDRNMLLLSFMVLVSVVSLSEDLLDVNKGIFIYAFFFSFLSRSKKKMHAVISPGTGNLSRRLPFYTVAVSASSSERFK